MPQRSARRAFGVLGVIAACVVPAALCAQRPDYKNLRFDELWKRTDRTSHWDDQIKAIPLAPGVSLTIGGQARWREEFAHAFNLSAASDTYGQSRLLLNADLHMGDTRRVHGRVFVELRDAQSYHRTLPGGTRAGDADRSDIQNLFADIAFAKSLVRVGRQEITTGRERLIGVPDWTNTRRGFEGVRALIVRGAFAIDAFDARPVVVRLRAPNIGDTTTRVRAFSLGSAVGAKAALRALPTTWQAYWYEQVVSTSTRTRRLTSGARAAWTFNSAATTGPTFGLETEAAVQRGATGARALHAWFWTSEWQTQWRRVRGMPMIAVGLEEASGDRHVSDTRLETFNTLYAAAHAYGGYADVFGRANEREVHMITTWDATKKISVRGAWHRYNRLQLTDGVYTKQNTVLRAASGSQDRHVGDEIDLSTTINVSRHLRLTGGQFLVEPGAFLRNTPGGAVQERLSYLGTTFTF